MHSSESSTFIPGFLDFLRRYIPATVRAYRARKHNAPFQEIKVPPGLSTNAAIVAFSAFSSSRDPPYYIVVIKSLSFCSVFYYTLRKLTLVVYRTAP